MEGGVYKKDIDICGIYLCILNCEYRNDRIISDSTKYGYPI